MLFVTPLGGDWELHVRLPTLSANHSAIISHCPAEGFGGYFAWIIRYLRSWVIPKSLGICLLVATKSPARLRLRSLLHLSPSENPRFFFCHRSECFTHTVVCQAWWFCPFCPAPQPYCHFRCHCHLIWVLSCGQAQPKLCSSHLCLRWSPKEEQLKSLGSVCWSVHKQRHLPCLAREKYYWADFFHVIWSGNFLLTFRMAHKGGRLLMPSEIAYKYTK